MDCLREACRNIRDDWSECPGFTPAIPCRGDRSCIGGCRGATSFSAHAGLVRSASNNLQYRTIFTRESQARQSFLDACNAASLPLYSNDWDRRADLGSGIVWRAALTARFVLKPSRPLDFSDPPGRVARTMLRLPRISSPEKLIIAEQELS